MALRSAAFVVLLALCWGSAFPLLKIAVETIPPLTVAAGRALGGGLILLAALGRRGARELVRVAAGGSGIWIQAVFNCILPWTLIVYAARTVDASLMTILNSLSPIFIFLLTWAITRHEVASPRRFVGVALGLAGVVAIVGVDVLRGLGAHTLGQLACVAGSISYAIAGVLGVRYHTVSPLVPAAGAVLISSVALVPAALALEGPVSLPSLRSALALAALCVFSTGLALFLYFRLLATIGSIATSSQAYLRIFVGVGGGVVFLGETLTPGMVVGMVLVIGGVVAMTLPDAALATQAGTRQRQATGAERSSRAPREPRR